MKLNKKGQIEQKAKELFWKYGFKKVSIDEICKKATVSRKTFYTFYGNKNALIIYLYNKMIEVTYAIYKGTYEVKPNVRLLKMAVIYGANASGKSNLIFAIQK